VLRVDAVRITLPPWEYELQPTENFLAPCWLSMGLSVYLPRMFSLSDPGTMCQLTIGDANTTPVERR
jgi:hypothetical protein